MSNSYDRLVQEIVKAISDIEKLSITKEEMIAAAGTFGVSSKEVNNAIGNLIRESKRDS